MPDTYTPNLNLKKPGYDSPADIADINANMDKIDTSVNQLSEQMVDYRTAENLLLNSNWRTKEEIVNQRGQSTYNQGDTIDRWKNISKGSVVVGDEYITFVPMDANENQVWFQQDTPNCGRLAGKPITFAAGYADGHIEVASAVVTEDFNPAYPNMTGFILAFGKLTDGVLSTAIVCRGEPVSIEWVALYEGSYTLENLPPYVPKRYSVELAECRRYFKKVRAMLGAGAATRALINFEPMRVVPTPNITVESSSNDGAVTVNGTSDSNIDIQYSGAWCAATVELDADIK